jgi:hypothetical protein
MDIIDFFRTEQKRLHSEMRSLIQDLTADEWHYLPGGKENSIAFLVWHSVRTEDNVLRFILQGRPPRWNEDNWHERLHLPARVQGTGMETAEAQALRIADTALFMEYVEQVWSEFETYLAGIHDGGAELGQRTVTVRPIGQMLALQAIGQTCISHLFMHLGEISALRGYLR